MLRAVVSMKDSRAHIKDGHRILYRGCIMTPSEVQKKTHVLKVGLQVRIPNYQATNTGACAARRGSKLSILQAAQPKGQQPIKQTNYRLMIEILLDLIYQNCRNYGSIEEYIGSCEISIINRTYLLGIRLHLVRTYSPPASLWRYWLFWGGGHFDSCRRDLPPRALHIPHHVLLASRSLSECCEFIAVLCEDLGGLLAG